MLGQLEQEQIISPPSAGTSGRDEIRNPLGFFLWLTRTYGDIVQYRSSVEPAYLINHPDYIQHVLLSNGHNYNKNTFLNKYLIEAVAGQGLLTSENPLWRKQRHLIQPAFHRRSLPKFAGLMRESVLRTLNRLDEFFVGGQTVDIANEMMRLTLDIVTQALFGYDINDKATIVGESMDTMVSIGKPRHRKVREAIDMLDQIVFTIIDDRRQNPDPEKDDLLAMLINARYEDGTGMSDRQIRDEVMALMVAGHETTANTLSWTWYLLAQHVAVVETLESEYDAVLGGRIPNVDDLPRLTYTDQVIHEGMRLYPSAWSISRRALGDDVIGGYHIPANSIVAMSPYTMHRHPDFWTEPEKFDPERFTPEKVAVRPRFAYFPFGGGARQCIGNHFALMESMIIIPAIVQRYRLHLVPDHPVEEHALVTLRPRSGILVTLEKRN
ncbi:MAG: cytochrome P450 [Chloroflexota bacterium]